MAVEIVTLKGKNLMRSNEIQTLQELQWKDVREEVAKKNNELAKIIDELNPGPEYTVFKARYHFGSEILKNGDLYIPDNKGDLILLSSSAAPAHIQSKLGYNLGSNPAGILLNHTAEIFLVQKT